MSNVWTGLTLAKSLFNICCSDHATLPQSGTSSVWQFTTKCCSTRHTAASQLSDITGHQLTDELSNPSCPDETFQHWCSISVSSALEAYTIITLHYIKKVSTSVLAQQSLRHKLSPRRYAAFDKRCITTWSLRVHRTESVSVMGHTWSAEVSSTASEQRQWNFFVHHLVLLEWGTTRSPCPCR